MSKRPATVSIVLAGACKSQFTDTKKQLLIGHLMVQSKQPSPPFHSLVLYMGSLFSASQRAGLQLVLRRVGF